MARIKFQGSNQRQLGGGNTPRLLGGGSIKPLGTNLKPGLKQFFEIVRDGMRERLSLFGDRRSDGRMTAMIFKPNNPLMGRGDQPTPGHGSTLLTSQGYPEFVYRSHHPETGGNDRISLPTEGDRWPVPPGVDRKPEEMARSSNDIIRPRKEGVTLKEDLQKYAKGHTLTLVEYYHGFDFQAAIEAIKFPHYRIKAHPSPIFYSLPPISTDPNAPGGAGSPPSEVSSRRARPIATSTS